MFGCYQGHLRFCQPDLNVSLLQLHVTAAGLLHRPINLTSNLSTAQSPNFWEFLKNGNHPAYWSQCHECDCLVCGQWKLCRREVWSGKVKTVTVERNKCVTVMYIEDCDWNARNSRIMLVHSLHEVHTIKSWWIRSAVHPQSYSTYIDNIWRKVYNRRYQDNLVLV
jgi:hypothetical protein